MIAALVAEARQGMKKIYPSQSPEAQRAHYHANLESERAYANERRKSMTAEQKEAQLRQWHAWVAANHERRLEIARESRKRCKAKKSRTAKGSGANPMRN